MPETQPASRPTGSFLNREATIIAGYFAATIVLGAALAPLFFRVGKALAGLIESFKWTHMPVFGFVHEAIGKSDFPRFFDRAVLVAAIICLWPAAKLLRLRRGELGLVKNPAGWRQAALGFALAAGLLLAMGYGYVQAGWFRAREDVSWGGLMVGSLLRAVGAGVIEEWFFRGALLGLMLRAGSQRTALIFVTAVFAAVHFLQAPDDVVITANVGWGTGFWLIGQIVGSLGNANLWLAQFATLAVVGWILGRARLRTHSLWLGIGLHGGWIFGIGLFAGLARTTRAVGHGEMLPWVGETLKIGLVPLAVLAVTGAAVRWLTRAAPDGPSPVAAKGPEHSAAGRSAGE